MFSNKRSYKLIGLNLFSETQHSSISPEQSEIEDFQWMQWVFMQVDVFKCVAGFRIISFNL